MVRNSLFGSLRIAGIATVRAPERYWPVIESLTFNTPLTGPL